MSRQRAGQGIAFAATLLLAACTPEPAALVGTIEYPRIEIRASAFEPVVSVAADEGSQLAAGDEILRQSATLGDLATAQAQADLEAAQAELAAVERGPRRERGQQAQAALRAARVRADEAVRETGRLEPLARRGLVAKAELDRARATARIAAAEVATAQAAVDEINTGATAEELDQVRARIAAAQARVDASRERGSETVLRAPVAGLLDSVLVEAGDRPQLGETVAILLAGTPYVRYYVPQAERASAKVGDRVLIQIDGIAEPVPAQLRHVAAEPAFTPFYALTDRDRGHLVYLAEADLIGPARPPAGLPVRIERAGD